MYKQKSFHKSYFDLDPNILLLPEQKFHDGSFLLLACHLGPACIVFSNRLMVGVEIPLHGAGLDEGEGFELGAGDLDKFGIIALRGAALLVFFVHTLFRITPILYTHGNIKYQTLAHIK